MQPLARTNLAETALNSIRDEILAKRWSVGERLPNEASLSSMLSVSRGTVREAVRVLVAQGYLETRQGSGTYVRSAVDPARNLAMARRASLRDRLEARCALDVEGARLAALRQTPAIIAGLRTRLLERGHSGEQRREVFVERDLAFHKAVIAASGNRAIMEIYEFFSASIQETIEATLTDEMPEPDMQAHADIVDAIETGDADRAEATVRRFMAPMFAALDKHLFLMTHPMPDDPEPLADGPLPLVDAEADSLPPPQGPEIRTSLSRLVLGTSLVLIAFNLRAIFSSASALLPEIRTGLGLSATGASLLTTLPVLCLGLFSPLAPRLAQRIGAERTLLGVLLLLALGTALRGLQSVPLLFLGTALAGGCIAVGNVLLPGLVKRDFPDKAALMTGFYTMALCASAAGAAGLTLPAERLLGGSLGGALAIWALPAFVTGILWLPQALTGNGKVRWAGFRVEGLWKDRVAWNVTLFMGLQSALAYCVFGWLVPILRERGLDGVTAGAVVSVSVIVQALSCLAVPHIAMRGRDQRLLNAALCAIAVTALLGLLFAPLPMVWIWAVLQGVGQGGLIAAAMTVIVLRSRDAHVAAHLSGMAQCVGYMLAAIGPLVVGLIRSWTGSFAPCAILFVLLGLGAAIQGWGAGRTRHVEARTIGPGAG